MRREDLVKGDKGQPILDMPASKRDAAKLLPNNTRRMDEAVNLHDGIKMAVSPDDDEFYDTDSDMEFHKGKRGQNLTTALLNRVKVLQMENCTQMAVSQWILDLMKSSVCHSKVRVQAANVCQEMILKSGV